MKASVTVSVFALIAGLFTHGACAQDDDSLAYRGLLVTQKLSGPATQPTIAKPADDDTRSNKGYTLGQFLITPSLTVSEEYDDNIYTTDMNETGDFITRIVPKVTATLQNSPHELKLNAGLEQLAFADETQNHQLGYNADFSDTYKLEPSTTWLVSGGIRKGFSMPGDDQANPGGDAGEPLPYMSYKGNTSITKGFGRFMLAPRLGFLRYDYGDVRRINGTKIDQGYRDRVQYAVGGRAAYSIDKVYQVFTDLEYDPINYNRSNTTERDSNGGNYLVGLRYKPDDTVFIEGALGYMNRAYDRAVYDDAKALAARLTVRWNATDLDKVIFNYNRSITEVTDTGVGGAVRDDARVEFNHDISDAVSAFIKARFINSAYQGGNGASNGVDDREDRYWEASIGMNYDITDYLAFTMDYAYGDNESNQNISDFKQNVFMAGLKTAF